MAEDIALKVEHLHKDFRLPHERTNSLKERVLHFRRQTFERLHALKDVNLEVKRGEFFGIVGRNGSGKSTLLKIIGGIYQPTKGKVQVNGTLTPFIELGIGFNPELTGRENVFLNGAILGLTRKEIAKKYQEIVDFAEIEKFMDQKLKNYSSGMQVRLAFSIAIQAHNDILLIDEVLAVGDASFERKCFNVFKNIKRQGKTVIFVTHNMSVVQEYCDRAMLVDGGTTVAIGRSDKIARHYMELNYEIPGDQKGSTTQNNQRGLKSKAMINSVYTQKNESRTKQFKAGEPVTAVFEVIAKQALISPVTGITVKDLTGRPLFATNTKVKKLRLPDLAAGEKLRLVFTFENPLNEGTYIIEPAVANSDATEFYDWLVDGCTFTVTNSELPFGIIYPHTTITYQKELHTR